MKWFLGVAFLVFGLACSSDDDGSSGSDTCTADGQCSGSEHCAKVSFSDVGVCAASCTTTCSTGYVCTSGSEVGLVPSCLSQCGEPGGCSAGFVCAAIEGDVAVCVPEPWASSQGGSGGSGPVTNPGSGGGTSTSGGTGPSAGGAGGGVSTSGGTGPGCAGECAPGDTISTTCGECGAATQRCTDDCTWGAATPCDDPCAGGGAAGSGGEPAP